MYKINLVLYFLHTPVTPLQWLHYERDGVSNHQRVDCLFNCLFRRRSVKTSKLRVTSLWWGNSLVIGRWIPAQRTSNMDNVPIWWPPFAIQRSQNECILCLFSILFFEIQWYYRTDKYIMPVSSIRSQGPNGLGEQFENITHLSSHFNISAKDF